MYYTKVQPLIGSCGALKLEGFGTSFYSPPPKPWNKRGEVSALGKVRVVVGPLRGAASKSEQGECAGRTSACVQTAGEIAVWGAGVQRELETHDAKEKGEGSWWSHGAQQHDEKQCEKSADGKQCGFQGWRPKCS